MRGNNLKNSAGFSLLEVMVTLSMAGLVIAALSSSFIQNIYTQQQLNGRITAAILGRSKLAELVTGSEPGLRGEFPEPYKQFKWQATEEKDGEGIEAITLTVEWRNKNAAPRQATLKGYRNAD